MIYIGIITFILELPLFFDFYSCAASVDIDFGFLGINIDAFFSYRYRSTPAFIFDRDFRSRRRRCRRSNWRRCSWDWWWRYIILARNARQRKYT
jgi:hypothetical protein